MIEHAQPGLRVSHSGNLIQKMLDDSMKLFEVLQCWVPLLGNILRLIRLILRFNTLARPGTLGFFHCFKFFQRVNDIGVSFSSVDIASD